MLKNDPVSCLPEGRDAHVMRHSQNHLLQVAALQVLMAVTRRLALRVASVLVPQWVMMAMDAGDYPERAG